MMSRNGMAPTLHRLTGVFFDIGPNFYNGGPNDAALNQHYVSLYQQTKKDHPTAKVMLNAAGFPNDWVMTAPAADIANVWETEVAAYANNYLAQGPSGTVPAPTWWSSYAGNTGRISNIVYGAGKQGRQQHRKSQPHKRNPDALRS
jgi:hypothetical protein